MASGSWSGGRPAVYDESHRKLFLQALSEGYSVKHAAAAAGPTTQSFYNWRQADPEFAEAWSAAIEEGTCHLEDVARDRAVLGVKEPVFHRGEQVGETTRYSDNLLALLLRGRRPGTYGNQTNMRLSHTGEIETKVELKINAAEAREVLATVRKALGTGEPPVPTLDVEPVELDAGSATGSEPALQPSTDSRSDHLADDADRRVSG